MTTDSVAENFVSPPTPRVSVTPPKSNGSWGVFDISTTAAHKFSGAGCRHLNYGAAVHPFLKKAGRRPVSFALPPYETPRRVVEIKHGAAGWGLGLDFGVIAMSRNNGDSSIVGLYQNGMAVRKIAERKRVGCSVVYKLLNEFGLNVSSAIASKRRDAAERVRGGEQAEAVALDCGRSIPWLRRACADHGVLCWPQSVVVPVRLKTYRVLAELQNSPKKTLEAIADDHGVTKQRIGQMLTEARTNGMLFPGRIFCPEKRPHCSIEL